MRGGLEYAARIKYAGWGGPARGVRALCGTGLNRADRPALPPLLPNTYISIYIDFNNYIILKSDDR